MPNLEAIAQDYRIIHEAAATQETPIAMIRNTLFAMLFFLQQGELISMSEPLRDTFIVTPTEKMRDLLNLPDDFDMRPRRFSLTDPDEKTTGMNPAIFQLLTISIETLQ